MTQQPNRLWIKSTCAYCGVGCGVEAQPQADGSLKIRGDNQHPANYGKLCAKGLALGETVSETGRLVSPLLHGKPVTWENALSRVADKFKRTIEAHGKNSVAFYLSGQLLTEDYYVANKLMKGFIGSANVDTNSRLCMSSSVAAHKRAFGNDIVSGCYEDIDHAELFVLVGSNLAWCHPILFQRIKARMAQYPKVKVIVIDPRVTASCDIASQHLALKPGSDVALFNGLLAYISRHQFIDSAYVTEHTEGMDDAIACATFDAGDMMALSNTTDLSQDQLLAFFAAFTDTNKVMTLYSQGVNQSTQGTDKVNSIINCHLATGKIGKPGATPFSVTGQPNAMGGREVGGLANTLAAHMEFGDNEAHQLISDFWQTDKLATKPGLIATDMFDAMDRGEIKAVWIMATNPLVSLPDSNKIKRALNRCEFVVVSDCIEHTDTTEYADLLLPAQGWGEKSGTVTNSERRISRQRKVMATLGDAKPDWWIISRVAQHMGFERAFNYQHEAEIFKEYCQMTRLGNIDGSSRALNLAGLSELNIGDYINLPPQQWPIAQPQDEIVHQRMFSDGRFFTPSKKAQFIEVVQQDSPQRLSDKYPLRLNSGRLRDQWHTMTRTGRSAKLSRHQVEPCILINPRQAENMGIKSGKLAKLSSSKGHFIGRAVLSTQVTMDTLFVPIHWSDGNASHAKVCELITTHTDPYSRQPELKHTPVSITPFELQSEAQLLSTKALSLKELQDYEFDYWIKQKVDAGFLYRLASKGSPDELKLQIDKLLSSVSSTDPLPSKKHTRLDYYNKESQTYRSLLTDDNQISQGYLISTEIIEDKVSWFDNLLTRDLDKDIAQTLFSGIAQGNLAKGKIICTCKQVGKTQLCVAIADHHVTEVIELTRLTQAGSGCGSCVSELKELLAKQVSENAAIVNGHKQNRIGVRLVG